MLKVSRDLCSLTLESHAESMAQGSGKRKAADKEIKRVEYIPSLFGESDIFNPTIISFDGRRYRKYVAAPSWGGENAAASSGACGRIVPTPPSYPDGEDACMHSDDDFSELGQVEELPSGGVQVKIDVPMVFFKYIIGKAGSTKQRIEQDTKCKVWLPRRGEKGPVILQARTRQRLSQGKQRVDVITLASRAKEWPTHFVSIPLNVDPIMGEFAQLKETAMSQNWGTINEQLFQNPAKLHLTLGVLRLFSDEEEMAAAEAVKEAVRQIQQETLGTDPCRIQVVGLEIMNDDESAVDILYARTKLQDGSDRLQLFVDTFMSELGHRIPDFVEQRQDRQHVKLHVTIMNSKFKAKALVTHDSPNPVARDRAFWRRESFDARAILKEYRDHDFGCTEFNKLHLSKHGEYGPDGYFKCISEVLL